MTMLTVECVEVFLDPVASHDLICLMTCSSRGQLLLPNHKYHTTPFHSSQILQLIVPGYQDKLVVSCKRPEFNKYKLEVKSS